MILYLTYNDQPSGVYWSQVTDVAHHLNGFGGSPVRVVAFVSGRGYRQARRAIRERMPTAWVLPMVPKMRFWRWNALMLALVCLALRPSGIMARGVFATWMAQRMRALKLVRKVCFDGRGAYAAEWEEYRLIDDDALIAQFRPLEKAAIHASDFRLAVSHALVQHWRERYGWTGDRYVVVPCTLGADHIRIARRSGAQRPYGEEDVVVVYSGSTAGWQSFEMLQRILVPLLEQQPQVKVLFLSKTDANNKALQARFPGRVEVQWARPDEVPGILSSGDHGLLIREDTITNQVASPTKFAEYLAAGMLYPINRIMDPCTDPAQLLAAALSRDQLRTIAQS
ncbi:MAG: glycosyltransferase, partial [Flavobacteriales bacterium]